MIRRTLGACALLLLASPFVLGAQVVGHLPENSPFVDATGRHALSAQVGMIFPGGDPAGVGPKSGLMFIGRYEYDVPGPLWLTSRVGIAPGLERTVLDPLLTGPARVVGPRNESLFMIDGGLSLSLTGDKAWKGLAPRLHGSLGMVASLNSDYDVGGYRFGPKFMPSWGLAVRGVTQKDIEWYVDLTHALWRMNYPGSYTDDGSTTDPSIIGRGKTNPWNGNLMLTFGITRLWGR